MFFPSRVLKRMSDLLNNENHAYRAISGGNDGALTIWNLVDNTLVRTLEGHAKSVRCCSVFADGKRAIGGSWNKTLKIWNLTDGTLLRTFGGHTKAGSCV